MTDSDYGLSKNEQAKTYSAPDYAYLPKLPEAYRPKIGLIGAGGISEHHLKAYRNLGLEVTHIVDLHIERAQQRRDEFYPKAIASDQVDAIFDDPAIEVVDIATHPKGRSELVSRALRAGKHVLCQKPFVLDLDDGQALVDLADQCERRLAINQNGRWAPHFCYLGQAAAAGLIGPISSIDFSLQWDHTWTIETHFNEIHHLVLYDFAIHWFDITTMLLGDRIPETIFASVRSAAFQKAKPPFLAHVAIDYPDAQVTMGFNAHVQHGQEDRTTIVGRDGTMRAFGPGLNDQKVQLWTNSGTAVPELKGNWFDNGFEGTMAELLTAIAEGREPSNSGRNNLRSLELCFSAIASAEQGRVVQVGEVRRLIA